MPCSDFSPIPDIATGDHDALADALATRGTCRILGLPDADSTHALREDLLRLTDAGELSPAATGRGEGRALQPTLRGDRTLWLDDARCGAATGAFLASLDALRVALNERLFLGLAEVEAHYARYAPGTGYARHRDRFRDSDARVISLVAYLNDDWNIDDGGALRLHLDGGAIDIPPLGGTAVCFRSEIEHEVLPAACERLSIAAWFRRRP
ncbi:2OG-Fe(II) oxygenase [Pseudoluteimonas lycopersici]|uniref:2OG-Fe(II) oxygenase n=1 Tax=Pseudoluteimonas lycopersici TaxID=1324796 RepID=A0A516V4C5_9GAMM|nr:2OG-Fe(II) oxygenase [Lysobacter lycopersici]QDQ73353.1 2OG-Fe(II) oxygenase [Lysobacter lycopersici]